ncbi:hypothetical protein ACFL5O_06970 [Myxococcota bacterium]
MAKGLALTLVLLAIAITYWLPSRRLRTALGVDHLLSTGQAFLVVGLLLGLVTGERPAPVGHDLGPIIALASGWVGFATGMRFELRVLRTIPVRALLLALVPALGAATVVGALGGAATLYWNGTSAHSWPVALVLGAAAASTGLTLVAALRGRRAGRSSPARPVLRMIEFAAGIGDLVVVLLALVAFPLFRGGSEAVGPGWLMVTGIVGGAVLGATTWLFLGGRALENERLLLGLAMLTFTAGFAGWLHLSPTGVTAVAAMVLANLPGDRTVQLSQVVRRVERPAVVILMTMIGFHLAGHLTCQLWLLLAAMTVGRIGAKHLSGVLVTRIGLWAPGLHPASGWAQGLVPQGILGMTVALSFFHVWRDDMARTVLAAVATASLVNELMAPWFLLRLLRRTSAVAVADPSMRERGA